MACPGSIIESRGLSDPESDFAALGTAAHALAQHCLTLREEPWTKIGWVAKDGELVYPGTIIPEGAIAVDKGMADAVQAYLDAVEEWHPDRNQGNSWVERRFHCPGLHKLFYGTSDFVHLENRILDAWDYKHGVGIVVEAEDNLQLMYYAAGVLEDLGAWDDVDLIRLHIFQPRGWHWKGPHRVWEVSPDMIDEWIFDECVPAMDRALVSRDTVSGDHCRFCAARFGQCSALLRDMVEYEDLLAMIEVDQVHGKRLSKEEKKAMETQAKEGAAKMTPAQLGRLLELQELSKVIIKAASATVHGMLASGHNVPGTKLVNSRTNREFKEGAEAAAVKQFGKGKALTKPELKSPAQLDEMPEGKAFTARWAFKPEGGTTVALVKDPRRAIKRGAKSLFKSVK